MTTVVQTVTHVRVRQQNASKGSICIVFFRDQSPSYINSITYNNTHHFTPLLHFLPKLMWLFFQLDAMKCCQMGGQDFGHDAMHLAFYHEHIMWCGDQVSRMDIHSILDVISPEMVCGDSVFDGEGHGHQHEFVFREPLVL